MCTLQNSFVFSLFLKDNSSYSLIMHTDKKLGEIYKVKISLVSGYWFNDAWYLKKVAIAPMWNLDRCAIFFNMQLTCSPHYQTFFSF